MGSGSQSDQKTTTQELTPEQQRLLGMSMPNWEAFNASNPTLPGRASVAGFDPLQVQGQNQVLGAMPQAADTVNSANKENQYYTSGALLDPGSDPYVKNAIKGATDPIFDNLNQTTLPGIAADASTNGAGGVGANFGGSRQGIAEGLAVNGANRTAADVGAGIMNTARQNGIQSTLAAIGQAPGIAASSSIPGTMTSTVGDVRQGQAQNELSADTAAQQFAQWLPLLKAQMLTQGSGALPGGTVRTAGTSNTDANPFQMLIGGASAAGGLAGGISKLLPFMMMA